MTHRTTPPVAQQSETQRFLVSVVRTETLMTEVLAPDSETAAEIGKLLYANGGEHFFPDGYTRVAFEAEPVDTGSQGEAGQ